MKLYEVIKDDTIYELTKKEIKDRFGFDGSLKDVERIEIRNDGLFLIKPKKTIFYKKIHGSYGFPVAIY